METGTVKNFNVGRGFGFIVPDEGGPDVFFHEDNRSPVSSKRKVKIGDTIKYLVIETPKGLRAEVWKIA